MSGERKAIKEAFIDKEFKIQKDARGMLIYYVNVGMLPSAKAAKLVERMKEELCDKDYRCKVPSDIAMLLVPVRPPHLTKIEYLPFDPNHVPALVMEKINAKLDDVIKKLDEL